MPKRYTAWWAALTVMAVTAVLVVLDIADSPVHRLSSCKPRRLRCWRR